MTKRIKFLDGSGGKLINRYAIHPYRAKYLRMDCVIYDDDVRIELPVLDYCETCSRNFGEIRNAVRIVCTNKDVNKQLGHVGRICVDCQWYYEKQQGFDPPKTINEFLEAGFKPHLL